MSENNTTNLPPVNPSGNPADKGPRDTPPRKKKKHRLLKTLAVLLLLLILLVIFAPTILSMGWARGIAIGQANQQINGQIAIDNWNLGWFSPVEITGVKVLDKDGAQVATVGSIKTNRTLLQLAQMEIAGTEATISDLHANVRVDENGRTNLELLLKQAPVPAVAQPAAGPVSVPDFVKNITVKLQNITADIEKPGLDKVHAEILPATLAVADINQPIPVDLTAKITLGTGTPGEIAIKGTVDAFENNTLAQDKLTANPTITLTNIDSAAAAPFLADVVTKLQGVFNGQIKVDVKDGKQAVLAVNLTGANIDVAPKALPGDHLPITNLSIVVPPSTIDMPKGMEDWQSFIVAVGSSAQPLSITFDQGKATAFASGPVQAILNAITKAPGADARIGADFDIRIHELARTMPNTIKLMEGWKLTEAIAKGQLSIDLKPTSVAASVNAGLSDIKAVDAKGQPQTLAGATLEIGAVSDGMNAQGDLGDMLTSLRDIRVKANTIAGPIEVKAANIATPGGSGKLDLTRFNDYARVFAIPAAIQSGVLEINFASKGQFLKVGDKVEPTGRITLSNLAIKLKSADGKNEYEIRQPLIELAVDAAFVHGTRNLIDKITSGNFSARIGDAAAPLVDVQGRLAGDATLTPDVKIPFDVTKAVLRIADLQKQYGKYIEPLAKMGLTFESGLIDATVSGSLDGQTIDLKQVLAKQSDIRLVKAGAPQPIVNNFATQIELAATIQLLPSAAPVEPPGTAGGGLRADVSKFALTQQNNKFSVVVHPGSTLILNMPANGPISVKGPVAIKADIPWLSDRAALLAGRTPQSQPGDILGGALAADVEFSGVGISPVGTFDIGRLSVRTPDKNASKPEDLKGRFDVALAGDFSSANIKAVNVEGLVNAQITDTRVILALLDQNGKPRTDARGKPVSPAIWDMVTRANVQISARDIRPLIDLMDAFMPSDKPVALRLDTSAEFAQSARVPSGAAAAADTFTLQDIQKGAFSVALDISRQQDQTLAKVTKLTLTDLTIKNGQAPLYVMAPVDLSVDLAVTASANPAKPDQPITEQIKSIKVNSLAGNLGVATLSMTEPITLTDLATKPKAAGAIELKGAIAKVVELANVFQGLAPADSLTAIGDFVIRQTLSTRNDAVDAAGNVTLNIQDLRRGGEQLLKDERVTIDNNLTYDPARSSAAGSLKLDMAASKALGVDFNGVVDDLLKSRSIRDKATLTIRGDYAKLLALARAVLTPEQLEALKDIKITGPLNAPFTVSGSFPDKPFNEAIKSLAASGSLGIDAAEGFGATLRKFAVRVDLRDGILRIDNANGAETAAVNNGGLNIGGTQLDLAARTPALTIPAGQQIVRDVQLTPVMVKYVNSILPIIDDQKPGLINVKVVKCDRVPITDLAGKRTDGELKITYKLDQAALGGGIFAAMRAVDLLSENASDLSGTITGEATFAKGIVGVPNFVMATGEKAKPLFTLDGSVNLAQGGALHLNAALVTSHIKAIQKDKNIARFVPDYLKFPIGGTTTAIKLDFQKALTNMMVEGGKKALLQGFMPKSDDPKNQAKPGDEKDKPLDPLDLLKGLGGDKKDKKK